MTRFLFPFVALVPAVLVPSQEQGQTPAAAVAVHTALAPADRLGEAWWKERFDAANARIAQGDVELIFLGDSITQAWESEGKDVWSEFYGTRKALNLGFSGDRTQHVLWRLERHGLEALANPAAGKASPKLVVLMAPTTRPRRSRTGSARW